MPVNKHQELFYQVVGNAAKLGINEPLKITLDKSGTVIEIGDQRQAFSATQTGELKELIGATVKLRCD